MANQVTGSSSCNGRSSSLVNGKVVMNHLELLVAFVSLKDSLFENLKEQGMLGICFTRRKLCLALLRLVLILIRSWEVE